MPRPKKMRRVCYMPHCARFGPLDNSDKGKISMSLDEYEAIRLIDMEGLTQKQCALQMQVARTTVQGIYDSARQKLACALVEGRSLSIGGGEYELCAHGCGTICKKCHKHCQKSIEEE